jgi:hypothetical protein
MPRGEVRAIPSGWTVSAPTGLTVVCRTYDELVTVVSTRTGLDREVVTAIGLGGDPVHAPR